MHAMRGRDAAGGRAAGFTLIELLAVVIILSILSYFLVVNLTGASRNAEVQVTKLTQQKIGGALQELDDDSGDFAPSTMTAEMGTPPNDQNIGSECLYLALCGQGKPGFGHFDQNLSNTDDDALARRAPGFEVPTLFELCDNWGNPMAYFHWRDYGREDKYTTLEGKTGERLESIARAWKNPDTGLYYEPRGYQLISAGLDGEFGTGDDIPQFRVK